MTAAMRVTAEGREMIDGLRQNLAACVELAAEMGMAQGGLELIPVPRAEVLAAVALCDRLLALPKHEAPAAAAGAAMIAAERARQVAAEGWTAAHDDAHSDGALARASASYALPERDRGVQVIVLERAENGGRDRTGHVPRAWPWGYEWWKPTPQDRVRELVKAGALIAAEIDRLQRATPTPASAAGTELAR